MKKIFCEACGSHELSESQDCFVCDYCGTRYQNEDAIKGNSHTEITKSFSIFTDEQVPTLNQPEKQKKSRKVWGYVWLVIGAIGLLDGTINFFKGNLSNNLLGLLFCAILINFGYTMTTEKKRFLTAHLKTWQIWVLFLIIGLIFDTIF